MSESFGRYLKRERKLREIPLEEIARETKIKVGLLRALEEDRIEELPSPAIVKGFLRAYARMLGLSANDLQLRYQSFLEETAPDRLRPQSMRPWVPRKQRRLSAVGWLLLIALGVGVGLHLSGGEQAPAPEEESTSGAESGVVFRKNYLTDIDTDAPQGTPPRVAAESPDWPGPASGGVYAILRPLAPTAAVVSVDGGAAQPMELVPGQPVVRHAFRGMVIEAAEPAFLEVEMNGERLAPGIPSKGSGRIVLRAPELPPAMEESPSRRNPAASLEAGVPGEMPLPALPPPPPLRLAGESSRPRNPPEAPRAARAEKPRPGEAPGPAERIHGGSRVLSEPAAGSAHPAATTPVVPRTPSNSAPADR